MTTHRGTETSAEDVPEEDGPEEYGMYECPECGQWNPVPESNWPFFSQSEYVCYSCGSRLAPSEALRDMEQRVLGKAAPEEAPEGYRMFKCSQCGQKNQIPEPGRPSDYMCGSCKGRLIPWAPWEPHIISPVTEKEDAAWRPPVVPRSAARAWEALKDAGQLQRALEKAALVDGIRGWVITLAFVAIVGSLVYVPWVVQAYSFLGSYHGPVSTEIVYAWLWDQPGSGVSQTFTILWGRVLLQALAIIAVGALGWYLAPEIADFVNPPPIT